MLAPVLRRQQGFIARTLRLNRAPLPEWLSLRHAEGSVAVDAFTVAGRKLDNLKLTAQWDGVKASFPEVRFAMDEAHAAGTGSADLAYAVPMYHLNGTLEGPGIRLGHDVDIQSIGGKFAFQSQRGASNLQATEVELVSGRETYTGQGSSTPEGRLQFELLSGKKALRVTGTVSPFAVEVSPVRSPN